MNVVHAGDLFFNGVYPFSEGKNIDEIVAAKLTADYDEKWGGGFLKPDQWVQIAYSVMQNR